MTDTHAYAGNYRMDLLATAYYDNHQLMIEQPKWGSKFRLLYDGNPVAEHSGNFGVELKFTTNEDGQVASYRATVKWGMSSLKNIEIRRNQELIFSNAKGFTPPPAAARPMSRTQQQPPQQPIQTREIVREVVLVVCPHCAQRNESSLRKCQNCGAAI